MNMDNFSKTKNKNTQMGRGLGHFTFINSEYSETYLQNE